MIIEFQSSVSIYEQIVRGITIAIQTGEVKRGQSLPSVRSLASNIGVNLHTVNKAYQELQRLGVVEIDRRKGAMIKEEFPSSPVREEEDALIRYILADRLIRGETEEEILSEMKEWIKELKGEKS